ncbi:hypothetical protein HanRHA438_Chr15g0697301 [Helianthus annuus]|nr:hypothetical protein HanRHA438_Chr15g0697301 [Helianthus annuus]
MEREKLSVRAIGILLWQEQFYAFHPWVYEDSQITMTKLLGSIVVKGAQDTLGASPAQPYRLAAIKALRSNSANSGLTDCRSVKNITVRNQMKISLYRLCDKWTLLVPLLITNALTVSNILFI